MGGHQAIPEKKTPIIFVIHQPLQSGLILSSMQTSRLVQRMPFEPRISIWAGLKKASPGLDPACPWMRDHQEILGLQEALGTLKKTGFPAWLWKRWHLVPQEASICCRTPRFPWHTNFVFFFIVYSVVLFFYISFVSAVFISSFLSLYAIWSKPQSKIGGK